MYYTAGLIITAVIAVFAFVAGYKFGEEETLNGIEGFVEIFENENAGTAFEGDKQDTETAE